MVTRIFPFSFNITHDLIGLYPIYFLFFMITQKRGNDSFVKKLKDYNTLFKKKILFYN